MEPETRLGDSGRCLTLVIQPQTFLEEKCLGDTALLVSTDVTLLKCSQLSSVLQTGGLNSGPEGLKRLSDAYQSSRLSGIAAKIGLRNLWSEIQDALGGVRGAPETFFAGSPLACCSSFAHERVKLQRGRNFQTQSTLSTPAIPG